MYQNQVYVPTTKAEALQPVDLKPSAGWFLLAAGSLLLPYVPDFIGRLLDLPNQVMANGYGCCVKKGDFELKFGKQSRYLRRLSHATAFAASVTSKREAFR